MKNVNLISPIKNKMLFSVFSFLFLLFIGFWSVSVTIDQPLLHLANRNITVDTNVFSTAIYKKDIDSPVIKISPLTDYYYKKDYRNHVMTKVINENREPSWEKFVIFLENMVLGNNRFVWKPSGVNEHEAIATEYTIKLNKDGSISITRNFFNNDIVAIGQAITYCDECYVGDNQKRLYTNGIPGTSMLEIANKMHYLPVVTERRLPPDINELQIIDRFGVVQVRIPVSRSDEVYYEEQWNLVEVKTPVMPKKQFMVQQEVKF